MTRDELEHAIRAACAISGDEEVYIVGSQPILGAFPDANGSLRQSMEVDLSPKSRVRGIDAINGALGELSLFHKTFKFYVDAVDLELITLPAGWGDRVVPVYGPATNGCTGWCLDPTDLAVSKLAAFRPKDVEFVRELIRGRYIRAEVLLERLSIMPGPLERIDRLRTWVTATWSEFA